MSIAQQTETNVNASPNIIRMDDQIKEGEIRGACSKHGRDKHTKF